MKKKKDLELPEELVEQLPQPEPEQQDGDGAEQPAEKPADELADAKARKALKKLTAMDEDEERMDVSLRSILGGDILAGGWFRRQFWFIVMLVFFAIIYVSNRYACQQEMIESTKLADTLLDRRYKALTRSSQLLEKTLRSRVEEELLDSTLQTATSPSFTIKTEEE